MLVIKDHVTLAPGSPLVGMSTVYEAIAAREWGVELVERSNVTAIGGTSNQTAQPGIDAAEVVRIAERSVTRSGRSWCDSSRRV